MNDLMSIETKRRKYNASLSAAEKGEKEAWDEVSIILHCATLPRTQPSVQVEAAKLNLAAAEERLRAAERRLKEVKEDKAVAQARGASIAQEHVQVPNYVDFPTRAELT